MTDYADTLRNVQRRNSPPGTTDADALAPLDFIISIPVSASADASTAVAIGTPTGIDVDAEIVGATFASATSNTSDATSYANINLYAYTASGTVSAVAAYLTTSTTAVASLVTNDLTVVTSLARVPAGGVLRAAVAKTSGGTSTGAATLNVRLRRY